MKQHTLNINNFDLVEIESIELIGENNTIDINVEDTHMFFANDIYTHNSGIDTEVLTLNLVSEAISKAQVADFWVCIGRTLKQKSECEATMLIAKNRMGKDGIIFPLHFDTAKVRLEVTGNQQDILHFLKEDQTNRNNSDLKKLKQAIQELKKEKENE